MSDPILNSLKEYWESLRAGRLAPYRSEIDPRQFEHALENMFILEIIGKETVRVRLAGMKLCEMMGMEVRGMSPRAFMMPEDRSRFDAAIMDVVQKPSVADFVMETVDYNGKSGTAYLLLMPLRSDFGEITRILGCISDNGEHFEAPVRMRITQARSEMISFKKDEVTAPMPGFAEHQKRYETPERRPQFAAITGGKKSADEVKREKPKGKRGHLRLVDKD